MKSNNQVQPQKIAQEILDVLIRYNLSAKQAREIITRVYHQVGEIAILPTTLAPMSEQ